MTVTANDAQVLHGEVTEPRMGAWTATVDVVSATPIAGKITLKSFDSRWSLVGSTVRSETFADSLRLFLVAGAGGLTKEVSASAYVKAPAKTIIADLLSEVGEKLAASSKVPQQMENWARVKGRADVALSSLVDLLGLTWRVLPTGEVWVGEDAYPIATDSEAVLMDRNATSGAIYVESPAPFFHSGTTAFGAKIETVLHSIGGMGGKSTLFASGTDRLRGALKAIVGKAQNIDYHAGYFARVISQNGDGTLELKPDDPRIPGLSKVPIKLGLPGFEVKVKPGARVAIEWDGGNPSIPRATVWDVGGLLELKIVAETKITIDAPEINSQKGRPLARLGDFVQVISTPPGTPAVGQITTANKHHKG